MNVFIFILKRVREVELLDGSFPMRVNNQRLFQEFALQTPKTKPKGFVRERKVTYPCPLNSFAVFSGREPLWRVWLQGLPWGIDTFHYVGRSKFLEFISCHIFMLNLIHSKNLKLTHLLTEHFPLEYNPYEELYRTGREYWCGKINAC